MKCPKCGSEMELVFDARPYTPCMKYQCNCGHEEKVGGKQWYCNCPSPAKCMYSISGGEKK